MLDLQRAIGALPAIPRAMTCVLTIGLPDGYSGWARVWSYPDGVSASNMLPLECDAYDCSASMTVALDADGYFKVEFYSTDPQARAQLKLDISTRCVCVCVCVCHACVLVCV